MPTRYLRTPDGGFVPYSGGGSGGTTENAVKYYKSYVVLENDVNAIDIPLPCGANKLILFSLVLVLPEHESNTGNTFNLYVNSGGNFNMANMSVKGSINLTGIGFGDDKYRIASSTRTDAYFEHTTPLINGTGVSNWFGGSETLRLTSPDDYIFSSGSKYWFWGMYK